MALLASPGMGHLIPVLELGQCFPVHHRFLVTIFVLPRDSSYQDLLNVVCLPLEDVSHLVMDSMAIVSQLVLMMRHAMPILFAEITPLKPRPSALMVNIFVRIRRPNKNRNRE
ncbi:hypothetical protein ACJRO7_035959 [Eucalyptus globulus]|uniref:Uncharacterized protein n=1 Tax=Eucalyptus globulus TaxID=34317 RepID=A0ABD3JAB2_EUCGL